MCSGKNICNQYQYVEENERLRAILGEWSTRAAKVLHIVLVCFIIIFNDINVMTMLKLERAVEVERMSNLELQKKISTFRSPTHTSAESSEQRGA